MTDKLERLFELQANLVNRYLNENVYDNNCPFMNTTWLDLLQGSGPGTMDWKIRETFITDTCDFIAEESFELKRHFNYKSWKTWKQPDMVKAREELIDIWHFVIQQSLLLGMNAEYVLNAYEEKNKVNHERQSGDY